MRKIDKVWILAAVALLVVPTSVLAQTHASKDFPDGGGANIPANGNMTFDLNINAPGSGSGPFPNVGTPDVAVTAGWSGDAVSAAAVDAICLEAIAEGYGCTGTGTAYDPPDPNVTILDCTGLGCCTRVRSGIPGDPDGDGTSDVTCTISTGIPPGLRGFKISRTPGLDKFDIDAVGGRTRINTLNHTTDAGNVVGTDILSRFCVQVDRGSSPVNGAIDIIVRHFHGTAAGVQTSTFSVNSTGLSDLALHDAIAAQFVALGLGLQVGVTATADSAKLLCGGLVDHIALPNVVTISNVPGRGGIIEIRAKGQPGQMIIADTSLVADEGVIPTLSEWGLILLVALLSLSALWMLRRRRQISSTV